MGREGAELRLLDALQRESSDVDVHLRVVGWRSARRYARGAEGHWVPGKAEHPPRTTWRRTDLVHLLGLDVAPPEDRPYVLTVFDLAPRLFSDEGTLPPWSNRAIQGASRVITTSTYVAGQIEELFGVTAERIRTIPLGPVHDAAAAEPLPATVLSELGLSLPLVLRMGGYTRRKNVEALLDAWPQVFDATKATLALVGPPDARRDALLAERSDLAGVVALDYLPSTLIRGLMKAATVLTSTSTYEGFGLPPLEAMSAGLPVVALRSPSIEEVCGDAALMADDSEGLASAIVQVITDSALRARLVSRGAAQSTHFTWPKAAAAARAVYVERASF
jgi:glycosyltransferase involved in cell wall biosynthesis